MRHKVTLNIDHFKTPISKFPYYSVSFYFIRFIIPNKFEAFAIYFFPIFFWNNTGTSDKPFRMLCKAQGAALTTSEMVVIQQHLLNTNKSK
jgi:hypothetical protein